MNYKWVTHNLSAWDDNKLVTPVLPKTLSNTQMIITVIHWKMINTSVAACAPIWIDGWWFVPLKPKVYSAVCDMRFWFMGFWSEVLVLTFFPFLAFSFFRFFAAVKISEKTPLKMRLTFL
jgi:hypothetical protein